jgi:uncharacterized protein YdeI (YjbR/CyaY-like superfamily)
MTGASPPRPSRLFRNRAAWRAWLAANHSRKDELWLVYYKKGSGRRSVTYMEALEEALCFGWIDSTVNAVDAERYAQRWTPRKDKSIWSARNKAIVARLEAGGLMTAAGKAKILTAKRNGSWHAIDAVDVVLDPPRDFLDALARAEAGAAFDRLPATPKKLFVGWIIQAKRPETRARRIDIAVRMIQTGRRPGIGGMKAP